jgi:hypothetical protein
VHQRTEISQGKPTEFEWCKRKTSGKNLMKIQRKPYLCCSEGICSDESCCLKCCNIGGWWTCGKTAKSGACELHDMCPWLNGWLRICDNPSATANDSIANSPPGLASLVTRSNLSPLLDPPGLEDWCLFANLSYPSCVC